MTEIIDGKRKFIIWMVGAALISGLVWAESISDLVFRDCFIGLTGAVIVGYASEYFGKK